MTFAWQSSTIMGKSLALLALMAAVPATIGLAETVKAAELPESAILSVDYSALDSAMRAPRDDAAPAVPARELECMAKVVHHEAANQPREGQLAVAQLLVNRKTSGRFADTICGVVSQRGQFFDVDAYAPRQDERWAMAVAVSMEALGGAEPAVAPGALFFHASYQKATTFFRTRQRVATLGSHVFYR